MCGILGFISINKINGLPLCIKALKKLEYRGYDSAGIAYIIDNKIKYIKKKGNIKQLESIIPENISTNIAISHTRWATHGAPSDINSHPHTTTDNTLSIVHNGIIENYSTIKQQLIKENYHFSSETDTEVLINFIHYINTNNPSNSFIKNLEITLNLVEGAYAIIVLNQETPNTLYIAKKGSPLSIGKSDDTIYISSDYYAFAEHTTNILHLEDNQIASINNLDIVMHDFKTNKIITPEFNHLNITLHQLEKDTFSHFMLKEIMKQSESLNDCFRGRLIKNGKKYDIKLGGLETLYKDKPIINILAKTKKILICACGTSMHSGLIGKYIIEELTGINVEVEQASEFRYRTHALLPNTVVMVISQSGETADTLEAMRICKNKGLLCLGLCNVVGSSISRETHGGVYLHIGPEIGVASTKAFTAQLGVLYIIAIKIALLKKKNILKCQQIIADLLKLDKLIEEIINKNLDQLKLLAKIYKFTQNCLFLGRGFNYPVALEGALKLKEISYIHAEGYSAAEMKHGPIALIDKMMPVIIICIQDKIYSKVKNNLLEVKSRGGSIISITNYNNPELDELSEYVIQIPTIQECLYPFLTIIPLQLLSYYIALERGCNVDQPRNLAKCVTVE